MMLSDYKRLNPVAQVRELREAQRRAHRAPTALGAFVSRVVYPAGAMR